MEILVSHFCSVHELELPGFIWRIQAGGQWGYQSLLPLLLFHFLQTCFCKGGMGFCCVLITLLNLQYHRNHKYVPYLVHCSLPNSRQGDTVHIYPIINQRLMTYSISYFHASLLRIQLNFFTMLLLQHQFCVAKWLQGPSANTESESEVAQLCPTLCNPTDSSLLGSTVHGIFQARILDWAAISFSRGFSQPRDRTQVFCIADRHFTI